MPQRVPRDKMRIFVRGRVKANQRDGNHAETAGVHRGARHGGAAACIMQENHLGVDSKRQRRAWSYSSQSRPRSLPFPPFGSRCYEPQDGRMSLTSHSRPQI
jgi:hypothetical protein